MLVIPAKAGIQEGKKPRTQSRGFLLRWSGRESAPLSFGNSGRSSPE